MIQYFNLLLILVLIIIAVLILLDLKKKKDSDGDVYSKSDHEGFRDKIITDINNQIDNVKNTILKFLKLSFFCILKLI